VGNLNLALEPGAEITLDAEVAYRFGSQEQYTVVPGADNLFNNFPERNPFGSLTSAKYPELAPMGGAGSIYYIQLRYEL
jgi:iron complex outermembrane receptor protein